MEKKMETSRFRGYVGFRVQGLGPQMYANNCVFMAEAIILHIFGV